jgi:acyl carrier protein
LAKYKELLHRLLGSGTQEVAVPARDLRTLLRLLESIDGTGEETASPHPAGVFHPRPALATPFVEPRSELEAQVAGLWRDLLGLEGLGVEDSFFELGGHSLLATRLMSQVRDHFGVEVRIARFFDAPTVSGLAAAIVELQAASLEEAALAELLAEIQGLSAEDLQDQLAAEKESKELPVPGRQDR